MQETIRSITARTLVVPLEQPVWIGGYAVLKREYCLVEITTTMERKGYSLGFTRGGDLSSAITREIAPHIMKCNIDDTEKIWEIMYNSQKLNGRQGFLMRALSLVDIALWDLKAKKAGLPLHTLLGGYRESIQLLMAGGYYAENKGLDQLCEEFTGYVEQGFKHLKLMVGGVSMEEDLERFIALRKCLPDSISLGIDANGAWQDVKAVKRWIEKAESATSGISFVEEPLPPEQMEAISWLRNNLSVPIAVGEFLAGRWTFKQYISSGCMDIVRADATLCGGITEWRRIAALADSYNLSSFPHYFSSIHFHLGMAFPGCKMIEVVSKENRNSSFHLIAGASYELRDGVAYPNHLPGLGLTIDSLFVEAHTAKLVSTDSC
ncbi:mandelate racemase/muconate lactonizing enzyme family protein [Paenibacillus eucommiae]|uniref:L-alanine-DL-glutamate epimerase-like enolase superfamily enzyme n=1 Tax=Paenibacillus eucommiae TaxID=1355755 RepID=A0ABS4J1Y1_9BACL|nr:mandelate racemase/muconate lactonizing enzyme family protein [Paenibacillus eucommiae]MBP1993849.1 L-alanine-DL-glutamate epimerase-like enolase superfamily enzyme [Paenibacillus eucommiae]